MGGGVETYWKSIALHATPRTQPGFLRPSGSRPSRIGSAHTSPAQGITSASHQALPVTSLQDEYLYVMVQVTRDLYPVACSDWMLPETEFELTVSDITIAQFKVISKRLERDVQSIIGDPSWLRTIKRWMVPLVDLLQASTFKQERLLV